MASDGVQHEAIANATKLHVEEIKEILEAQSSPAVLDPDIKLYSSEPVIDEFDD